MDDPSAPCAGRGRDVTGRRQEPAASALPGAEEGGGSRKVLIVEDDPSVANVIRCELEEEGWHPVMVGNADDGLAALRAAAPAAAVIDVRLPVRDGWWLVDQIRADSRFRDLPIRGHHRSRGT